MNLAIHIYICLFFLVLLHTALISSEWYRICVLLCYSAYLHGLHCMSEYGSSFSTLPYILEPPEVPANSDYFD
jgi:hypothetical protein